MLKRDLELRVAILEKEKAALEEHINILNTKITYLETVKNKKPGQKGFTNTEVLALIKKLRLQGYSLGGIAAELNTLGIKPKSGRQWYKSSIRLMLNK